MQRRNFIISTLTALPSVSLLAKTPNTTGKSFTVKSGEGRFGEHTRLAGVNPTDIKVSAKDTNGQLTLLEYNGHTKGGPPLHVHPHQDEIFYVMEGNYLFQVGEEKHTLSAGDTIFLPRQVPHTFAQLSDNGKMLFLFQGSGKMEDFFRTLGGLKGEPSPQEGAKIFEDHDMKVVGPPLAY